MFRVPFSIYELNVVFASSLISLLVWAYVAFMLFGLMALTPLNWLEYVATGSNTFIMEKREGF